MSTDIRHKISRIYPAYNPLYLALDSVNKTKTGFKYLVDIYAAGTTTILRRLKVDTNPLDSNYGYIDVSRICSHFIVGDPMSLDMGFFGINDEQGVPVTLQLGEEYLYEWDFEDNAFNFDPPYTARVGFTSTTTDHKFVVGDWINIEQTGTPTHDEYDGVHQIVHVPDVKGLFVNYPFLGSTAAEPGKIRFQDYRVIQFTGQTPHSTFLWDGVIDEDYHTYDWDGEYFTTSKNKFLTKVPNNSTQYKVRKENGGFLNVSLENQNYISDVRIDITDITNSVTLTLSATTTVGTAVGRYLVRCPFGPASINEFVGYDFLSASTSYSIQLKDSSAKLTETFVVNIDSTCTPDTDNGWTELLFEDTMSSYVPLNFRFLKNEEKSIKKKTHKRNLNYSVVGDNCIYDVSSQANKIYSIDVSQTITVHTGFIRPDVVALVENLLKSKNVYWKNGDEYIPVEIVTSSYSKKTSLRNAVEMDYTIEFKPQLYGEVNI